MMPALSKNVPVGILESIPWDPDVPCNHAGHRLRPLRKIIGPLLDGKEHELL